MPVRTELRRIGADFWRGVRLWAEPDLDLPLALFRWALGLAVLVSYGQLLLDYDKYYGLWGMCPRVEWRGIMPERSISYFRYIHNEAACKAIAFGALVPMVCFWWGIFPRISAAIAWYVLISCHDRCTLLLDGSDFVLRLMLFLFIFARSDRRLAPFAPVTTSEPSDSFPIRLMQVQLCLIYIVTGLAKIYGQKWINGIALATTLQLDSFSRYDWQFLAEIPLFINVSTYMTLFFELSFVYLVWPKATRPWILAMGVALHAGIELLMYVPMFSWAMMASYLTFFERSWAERAVSGILTPWVSWARRRGYAAEIGAGELALVPKLDVFRAVTWTPSEKGRLRVTRDGKASEGFGAWVKLATCMPSLLVFLPLLALPGGERLLGRSLARAAG